MKLLAITLATLAVAGPALAQQSGWHFSPLSGEGDRAALGCAYGADERVYSCLAVRCEDDFSVGLHVHTSRPGGDAGPWRLSIDDVPIELVATADGSPYHARVEADVAPILEAMKNGAVAYLEPEAGPDPAGVAISLSGSLYAINQALYFCAPKAPVAAPAAN